MTSQSTEQAPVDDPAPEAASGSMEIEELARKGGIIVALAVLVVAVFFVFDAVNDIIWAWLTERWVPVWRAVFALGVALAVYVIGRLTR